jgi:Cytidine deaminase
MGEIIIAYQRWSTIDELKDTHIQQLIAEARRITRNSYAPYSHFHVGATVLLSNNQIVHGLNIENASYPVGICAERSALSSAISSFPTEKIIAMAISYYSQESQNIMPIFPCGMCRQFMVECEKRNNNPIPLYLPLNTAIFLRSNL